MFNAARHGAVAVLVMPDPNHPKGMVRGALDSPQQARRRRRERRDPFRPSPKKRPSRRSTSTPKSAKNSSRTPAELQSAIDATLKPASASATPKRAARGNALRKRQLSYNVVGMVEGSDPALSAETIIISAHYDHDGLAAGGGIYHGADDNGSGTVGVVALAKAFTKNPAKPKRLFCSPCTPPRNAACSAPTIMPPIRSGRSPPRAP